MTNRQGAPAEALGYFSFSDECGFDRHDTAEAAKAAATEMLSEIRRGLGGDEWPMDVESICWGVVVERATEHDQTTGEDGEKYCDYVLKGASPTPPPAEQPQPRYSHLHDADAVHGKRLSVYSKPPAEQQAAPKAAPVKACVCGEPQAPGTVHRVDGPCYVAAPQQEAQEPAFWMNEKGHTWSHSDWKQFPKHRAKYPIPLYPHFPAPQPAPDCHHRPPCNECAAIAAQGGK